MRGFLRSTAAGLGLELILEERKTGFLISLYRFAVFGRPAAVLAFQRLLGAAIERYKAIP